MSRIRTPKLSSLKFANWLSPNSPMITLSIDNFFLCSSLLNFMLGLRSKGNINFFFRQSLFSLESYAIPRSIDAVILQFSDNIFYLGCNYLVFLLLILGIITYVFLFLSFKRLQLLSFPQSHHALTHTHTHTHTHRDIQTHTSK